MEKLQINALSEWIIGIYLHEFTNNGWEISKASAVLKISNNTKIETLVFNTPQKTFLNKATKNKYLPKFSEIENSNPKKLLSSSLPLKFRSTPPGAVIQQRPQQPRSQGYNHGSVWL